MQVASHALPRTLEAKKRVLVVNDSPNVEKYARRALRRDFYVWHAYSPEEASSVIDAEGQNGHNKKPFDLLVCDINMPQGNPTGLDFMTKFHLRFRDIPIICHSDDRKKARRVPFATFVERTQISECLDDRRFHADEAFLLATALITLNITRGVSLIAAREAAKRLPARYSIEDLNLPVTIIEFIDRIKKVIAKGNDTQRRLDERVIPENKRNRLSTAIADRNFKELSKLAAFATAGPDYLGQSTFIELLCHIMTYEKQFRN